MWLGALQMYNVRRSGPPSMHANAPGWVLFTVSSTCPPSASRNTSPVNGDAIQLAAERTLFHRTVVGAAIGAVVCAGLWIVIVLLAVADKGYALGPVVLVGAGCGIFAGIFLSGCAGALAGATALEHAEHATLPPLP